ncbi:SRPBCC family protein [Pseudodonghicola flavimaris]|uniref:SRPBCC family protein n=1 Tax=Pseudodonghicola flavimaris TaxID=3050036 RepID=A0ABT7EXD5_9RHOB|nr:SRPBCC family protein [Pseudodonghicola flavimaris]MDK3017004.1 SRPBCC family protein [Pseudodonghicola flavimaris]
MKFSSKEDIEAPIEAVFAALSEFESFERSAIRRGIEVQRVNENAGIGAGMAWKAAFDLRGKRRNLDLKLVEYTPPTGMRLESESFGLTGDFQIELVALSPKRTRMAITLTLSPKNLSARLFLQSLKLAKANLTKRFKLKAAEFAKSLEDRKTRMA